MKVFFTLAALAGLLALPISAGTTGSILFAAGLALIFNADYGRRFRPLGPAPQTTVMPACRQDLRLAA